MHRRHQGPHRRGRPILEIDHVHDLALGGADDPAQMIALCPNCHAIKTRGTTREGSPRSFSPRQGLVTNPPSRPGVARSVVGTATTEHFPAMA